MMDRILSRTLKYPLSIRQLTIFPPILKQEMMVFAHTLTYHNAPDLMSLQFQNWSPKHIALFCKSIHRLASIHYECAQKKSERLNPRNCYSSHRRNLSNSKSNRHRRKGHRRGYSMKDLDDIIAEMELNASPKRRKKHRRLPSNPNHRKLQSTPLFHHIHSFKMNVKNPSLLAERMNVSRNASNRQCQRPPNIVDKLYDPDGLVHEFDCDTHIERAIHKKGFRALLGMGDLLKYQFTNIHSFGLNHYQFLFASEHFMVHLFNGIAFHPYLRSVELQGIGRKGNHAINAMDISLVIKSTLKVSQHNFKVIDQTLEQYLSSKDVRVEVIKYLYGERYGNGGTGILHFDVSTNKKSAHRRHSIFSGLQTIRRQQDPNVIDTKLEGFKRVLTALDNNWRECGLAQSDEYWEWQKSTRKMSNVPKMRYFSAM